MSTHKNTAPAIRPQDDTRHEGVQAALDVLFDRQSALNQMFRAAADSRDGERLAELNHRLAEVSGLIRALRGAL